MNPERNEADGHLLSEKGEESETASLPIAAAVNGNGADRFVSTDHQHQYTVEDALTFIGFGTAQRVLLVVLGVGYASFSANISLMGYLEPNVKCEWHLSTTEQTMLSVVVLLGMAIGSNLWGTVSDRYGRKRGTTLSLSVLGISGVISSVAPSYGVLIAARGIVGVGVGSLSTFFSTYSEFLPTASRGYGLCWFTVCWALGAVSEAAAGWLVLPRKSWRTLTLITALPSLAILPIVALLPESPRYLIATGQEDRAKGVLKRIARINRSSLPVGSLKHVPAPSTTEGCFRQMSNLFARPLNRITPVVWFLAFTLGIGYYGTVILTAAVRTDDDEDDTCIDGEAELHDEDYFSILIDATAEVFGAILALFTIERFGRVRSLLFSWFVCWSSMLLLLLFPSMKTVFLFGPRLIVVVDIFLFTLTLELYPSCIRCFAMGTMSCSCQIGGMLSPFVARALLDVAGLKAVCAVYIGFFFVADVATWFLLPYETAGQQMRDDMHELLCDNAYTNLIDDGAEA